MRKQQECDYQMLSSLQKMSHHIRYDDDDDGFHGHGENPTKQEKVEQENNFMPQSVTVKVQFAFLDPPSISTEQAAKPAVCIWTTTGQLVAPAQKTMWYTTSEGQAQESNRTQTVPRILSESSHENKKKGGKSSGCGTVIDGSKVTSVPRSQRTIVKRWAHKCLDNGAGGTAI
ncbi:hypothetical protein BC835DRAFT_1310364 [Cytidiella melzeri]|nr:hypothetical protein BC835DRAFT_1310364 [Cytidiella melzeri]